jgi:hypothetical protein
MDLTRRAAALGGLALASGGSLSTPANAWDGLVVDAFEGLDEFKIASDAYIYGYPLVTMEMTRKILTNVAAPEGTRAPMGQMIKLRQYPNSAFRDVTAPNADTLYTTTFIDVGDEPWVLEAPNMNGRYFLLPFLDGWTEVFAVPGKRTSGTAAHTYLVTGPGWKGAVPAGMQQLKSQTSIVWLLGRIYCTGTAEDYAAVHALQDKFKLSPLSAFGKAWTAPTGKVDASIDMKKSVRDHVNEMSATQYFTLLAELLKRNPPTAKDAPALAQFAKIGLVPGKSFDASAIDSRWESRLPKLSFDRIMLHFKLSDGDVKNINGWGYTTKAGNYGTNYIQRALVTAIGLGANRPQDAVYPTSLKPAVLRSYDGANKYVMRFAKGQLPPAKGFWSLTMYDENYFFIDNKLNRYSMSMRTNPTLAPDGSLLIYIQNESPGADKEANWLPAPKGKFLLMMRLYWPDEKKPSIIDGSWIVPPVVKAS